jgi:hypothetical protein
MTSPRPRQHLTVHLTYIRLPSFGITTLVVFRDPYPGFGLLLL